MDVTAEDIVSGRTELVGVEEGDTGRAFKRRLGEVFGYDDVDVTVGGERLRSGEEGCAVLEAGSRVVVAPSVKRYTQGLSEGNMRLRDVPFWARDMRGCVLAACTFSGEELRYAAPFYADDFDVVFAAVSSWASAIVEASDRLRSDYTIIKAALQGGECFSKASDKAKADKPLVLKLLRERYSILEHCAEALRGDKEVVEVALAAEPRSFQYASEALRADVSVALPAVVLRARNLRFVGEVLLQDAEVVKAALAKRPDMLYLAHDSLRADKSVVMLAVKCSGFALMHAADVLRGDKDIVLAAVQNAPESLRFVSCVLCDDADVVSRAMDGDVKAFQHASARLRNTQSLALRAATCEACVPFIGESLRDNAEVMRIAIMATRSMKHVSERLRADRSFVLAAVAEEPCLLSWACDTLRADSDVVRAMLQSTKVRQLDFKRAAAAARSDKTLVLEALPAGETEDGTIMPFVTGGLMYDRDVFKASLEQGEVGMCPAEFADDKDIVLSTVANDGFALTSASPALQHDKDVVLEAVRCTWQVIHSVSKELQCDLDVVVAAVQGGMSLTALPAAQRQERGVALAAVGRNGLKLKEVPGKLRNQHDVVLAAVSNHGCALQYASKTLQKDADIVLAAVRNNGAALAYAHKTLCDDRAIVRAALQTDHTALEHASTRLSNDIELLTLQADAVEQDIMSEEEDEGEDGEEDEEGDEDEGEGEGEGQESSESSLCTLQRNEHCIIQFGRRHVIERATRLPPRQ